MCQLDHLSTIEPKYSYVLKEEDNKYIRRALARCLVTQIVGLFAIVDSRCATQTERSLVMNIHPIGNIGRGDNIDVVFGRGSRRLDRWGFDETREAFAISIDSLIDPVADGDFRSFIGKASVDVSSFKVDSGVGLSRDQKRAQEGSRCR